jgi:hypothetical protein
VAEKGGTDALLDSLADVAEEDDTDALLGGLVDAVAKEVDTTA